MWHGQQIVPKMWTGPPCFREDTKIKGAGNGTVQSLHSVLGWLVLDGEDRLGGSHPDGVVLPTPCLCRSVNWTKYCCLKGEREIGEVTQGLLWRLLWWLWRLVGRFRTAKSTLHDFIAHLHQWLSTCETSFPRKQRKGRNGGAQAKENKPNHSTALDICHWGRWVPGLASVPPRSHQLYLAVVSLPMPKPGWWWHSFLGG